jgi:Ca-activated chloride channel family protein
MMRRTDRFVPVLLLTTFALGCSKASREEQRAAAPASSAASQSKSETEDGRFAAKPSDQPEAAATAAAEPGMRGASRPPAPRQQRVLGAAGDASGAGPAPAAASSPTESLLPRVDREKDKGGSPLEIREPSVTPEQYFKHYGVNPTIETAEQSKSTFSIDVDNASYTMARNYLDRGQMPPEAAVRVEEVVNAFDYGYQSPTEDTFAIFADAAPSPNRQGYQVLHIGIKGKQVESNARQPAHLTFVVDVSGSMEPQNRLPLVKRSLRMLVEELNESDTVAIVVFGDKAREALAPTSGANKQAILGIIDSLKTEGSTNAEAGLRLGYGVAERTLSKRGIHRVILCSDGVANIGMTGPQGILDTVRRQVDRGITITTIGVGMGDYNDVLMEQLAQGGNGNYYYVDKLDEARRVFVEKLTGTLQTIAKDVKVQIDFDPKTVARYRLLGYENRGLAARDFDNDRVDAGEVGAGHTVTAIYEVKLHNGADGSELAKIRIRHKPPQGDQSRLIEKAVPRSIVRASIDELSSPSQLGIAAAGFAEKLRGSYWARNLSYDDILARFKHIRGSLSDRSDVTELKRLIEAAKKLDHRADKFTQHGPIAQMDFDRVPVLR